MSDPNSTRPVTKDARQSQWQRATNAMSRACDGVDFVAALPAEARPYFTMMKTTGRHFYNGIMTLTLEVPNREKVVGLIEVLRPIPLTMVTFDNRSRTIKPSIEEFTSNRSTIVSRSEVAPFQFSVEQWGKDSRLVMVTWLTRLKEQLVTIQAFIVKDPARFEMEDNGALLPSARRWRWVRNNRFPATGYTKGLWGHEMLEPYAETARCVMSWSLSRLPQHLVNEPSKLAHYLLIEKGGYDG